MWHEGRGNAPGRWRWAVVVDGGTTHHGWADTEKDGWAQVREVQLISGSSDIWSRKYCRYNGHADLMRKSIDGQRSRALFARRSPTLVSQPPLSYLTWWRMTTAGSVGYASEFAFANAFTRQYGTAPGRYRRAE
ncbi:MAG: hypothetical protein V7646_5187 [Pseudonocardia sp.]